MTTTDKLVAEVRRLDAEATKWPWRDEGDAHIVYGSHSPEVDSVRLRDGSTGFRLLDIRGWGTLSTKLGPVEAERIQRANCALVTKYRTAAPALADAVERRDEVIARLAEALRLATIENTVDPKSESAATEARWMLEGDFGLELVDGKWRIRET